MKRNCFYAFIFGLLMVAVQWKLSTAAPSSFICKVYGEGKYTCNPRLSGLPVGSDSSAFWYGIQCVPQSIRTYYPADTNLLGSDLTGNYAPINYNDFAVLFAHGNGTWSQHTDQWPLNLASGQPDSLIGYNYNMDSVKFGGSERLKWLWLNSCSNFDIDYANCYDAGANLNTGCEYYYQSIAGGKSLPGGVGTGGVSIDTFQSDPAYLNTVGCITGNWLKSNDVPWDAYGDWEWNTSFIFDAIVKASGTVSIYLASSTDTGLTTRITTGRTLLGTINYTSGDIGNLKTSTISLSLPVHRTSKYIYIEFSGSSTNICWIQDYKITCNFPWTATRLSHAMGIRANYWQNHFCGIHSMLGWESDEYVDQSADMYSTFFTQWVTQGMPLYMAYFYAYSYEYGYYNWNTLAVMAADGNADNLGTYGYLNEAWSSANNNLATSRMPIHGVWHLQDAEPDTLY